MPVNLLAKLVAVFHRLNAKDGQSAAHDPIETVRVNYQALLRLADQIHAHAQRAPYPHVARQMEGLALEKTKHADLLRETLLKLGGKPNATQPTPTSGKNHWERINRDIADQRLIVSRLLQSSVQCSEQAPEISALLERIAAVEASHVDTLVQILMRADPQAEQN